MSSVVTPLREGYALPRDREVVSPELALVDPELGRTARALLADSPGALHTPPYSTVPIGTPFFGRLTRGEAVRDAGREDRSWRVLIGVAAVTILSLLLFDVRVQVGRTPASAEAPQNPPAAAEIPNRAPVPSVPKGRVQKGRVGDTAKPRARRFAWAPIPGASAYHIEFFKGSVPAFSANTTRPEVTVPAHWEDVRGTRSLSPGEYRWYVWPVVSGTRSSTAIVRAKLVVS
jgi:hypothetical protein